MEKVILETIEKYNLFETDATLVVAVSGGADSMMLLHVMHKLGYQLAVAHVNHQKREDAWEDEALVRDVAAKLGIPVYVYKLPPPKVAANFQAYAREKRYEFFLEVASVQKTSYVVTAHHGEDHLETVIHRLLHHQSASGLQGILPATDFEGFKLRRPLARLNKKDIYDYCRQFGVPFREDASNQSGAYGRNRIRQEVVPIFYRESPQILAHVRQLSDGIAEDEVYFDGEVNKLWNQLNFGEGLISFSRSWFVGLPPSLSKRLLKKLLASLGIGASSERILDMMERLRRGNPNEACALPGGFQLRLAYDEAQFLTNPPKMEPYRLQLALNSIITLPNNSQLVINYKKDNGNGPKNCINEVHLCYNEIELPLWVRTRKNGDRIALRGGGTKKIKEIMIEAKIPKHLRDSWPVITDANDQIVWLPLLKKAKTCQDGGSAGVITLAYRHHGGS